MPVAIAQLNANPKHIVINLIKAQIIIQLNAHNAKKNNNVITFISPFLSNLPVYANINSPGYLNIHDTGRFFPVVLCVYKTRSIYRSRPLYKYLPPIFPPYILVTNLVSLNFFLLFNALLIAKSIPLRDLRW